VDLVDVEDSRSQSFPFLLSLLAANEQKIYVDQIKKNRYSCALLLLPAWPPSPTASSDNNSPAAL
jgi:hypothetical protein